MEELTVMQKSLQGVRTKIAIADPSQTHPLLHLWKDFTSTELDSFISPPKSEPSTSEHHVEEADAAVQMTDQKVAEEAQNGKN